jgi:hypothetical protein
MGAVSWKNGAAESTFLMTNTLVYNEILYILA